MYLNYDDTPFIVIPPFVPIIISYHESQEASSLMPVFRSESSSLAEPEIVKKMEEVMPGWLFQWIIEVNFNIIIII